MELHKYQHEGYPPRLADYQYMDFKVSHYTYGNEEFIACKDSVVFRGINQEDIQGKIKSYVKRNYTNN